MKKAIVLTLLALGGFAAKAQIPQPDPDTTAKHFLIVASIGNLQETAAGQLAAQKGKRADVQAFGKMMVTDHQQAQSKLLQLAKNKGYQLPAEATAHVQPDLNLKNASNAFDHLYVHGMVSSHRNAVQTFETYAVTGKDPDIRAFAQQMLPKLKAHLNEIKVIDEQIKLVAKQQ